MLRAWTGIAIIAILALPVVAQVRGRGHDRPLSAMQQAERDQRAAEAAAEAAANAAMAAAEAAGDNSAMDASYDPNATMEMDTNMSMDTNMTLDPVTPRHRRARSRHR